MLSILTNIHTTHIRYRCELFRGSYTAQVAHQYKYVFGIFHVIKDLLVADASLFSGTVPPHYTFRLFMCSSWRRSLALFVTGSLNPCAPSSPFHVPSLAHSNEKSQYRERATPTPSLLCPPPNRLSVNRNPCYPHPGMGVECESL